MWRSGRVSDGKPEILGWRPGSAAFETLQLCRRSSTFVKVCRKSSIFLVKFSAGMSETFFDTCVNWSCVTRCGCRTTSSSLFTVYEDYLLGRRRVCTQTKIAKSAQIFYPNVVPSPAYITQREKINDNLGFFF